MVSLDCDDDRGMTEIRPVTSSAQNVVHHGPIWLPALVADAFPQGAAEWGAVHNLCIKFGELVAAIDPEGALPFEILTVKLTNRVFNAQRSVGSLSGTASDVRSGYAWIRCLAAISVGASRHCNGTQTVCCVSERTGDVLEVAARPTLIRNRTETISTDAAAVWDPSITS